VPIFEQMPQQSDLEIEWATKSGKFEVAKPESFGGPRKFFVTVFPRLARLAHTLRIASLFYRTLSLRNAKFFKRVDRE